jgi:hypothetical protein
MWMQTLGSHTTSLISSIKFNGCPWHVKVSNHGKPYKDHFIISILIDQSAVNFQHFGDGRSVAALYKKQPKVVFALKG